MNTTIETRDSHLNILPIGTRLKVTKGCPTIGWEKGTLVTVDEIATLKDGTLLVRFKTPNGVRSLYPSCGNARGLKLLSFNNGNPLRRVTFGKVWLHAPLIKQALGRVLQNR